MDWYSRQVLVWRLSNMFDTGFYLERLREALTHYGPLAIFSSDQGAQFTDHRWVKALQDKGIRVSMDSKGRWRDNMFVERLWRFLKYERVYLRAFAGIQEAAREIP